jgi:hypothetical protein
MKKSISLQPVTKKSKMRVYLGVIALLFAVGLPIYSQIKHGEIGSIQWIFMFLFLAQGVIYILVGTGKNVSDLFGKKTYLIFDEDEIRFKTSNYDKEEILKADQIQKIELQAKFNDFYLKDDQIVKMYLTGFEYALIQEIKEGITEYAQINGIEVESK